MRLSDVRALRAPNVWARVPVLEGTAPDPLALAEHALKRQIEAGARVSFFAASGERFAVEFEHEGLARRALAGDDARALQRYAGEVLMGPNTRALYSAALRRGIPVRRLDDGSLLQLGHGVRQRRLCGAFTDRSASIGENIGWDKPLAKRILQAVGIPVPEGRRVADAEDACRAARELGGTVVVKPESANHGRAVFIGVSGREEVAAAFAAASVAAESPAVLVERFIPGAEHRVLVVNGEVVAATRGDPLNMAGDGRRTIQQLIDEVNRGPRRGEGPEYPLYPVALDEVTLATLARQGYAPDSIPPGGSRVLVQRNGNLGTDVTDSMHPENRALAALAVRTVGLDVAGVDLVVDDISRPIAAQGGAIVEVNAMPGLMMHLLPESGKARPVDDIIIASLFDPDDEGRIPLVAVHADAGLCREIGEQMESSGLCTGVVCEEGTWVGGHASQATDVLMHPLVEAAVIEVGAGAADLPFDRCDVVVTHGPAAPMLMESLSSGGLLISPAGSGSVERIAAFALSATKGKRRD